MKIVFEGADNLGKTTIAKIVCEKLGYKYLKFPNEAIYSGQILREILQGKRNFEPVSFQALNIIDRLLTPMEDNVIIDRYTLSGKIYGEHDGLPVEWCDQLNSLLEKVDLTFIFTGTPFTTDNEMYDLDNTISDEYNKYILNNMDDTRIYAIYANQSIEQVVNEVVQYINKFIDNNNETYKQETISLLNKIKRSGITDLIQFLEMSDFFTAPASTKYHNNFQGGLNKHCLNVYKLFKQQNKLLQTPILEESEIIVSICHDLCKIGCYYYENGEWKHVKNHLSELLHGKLSIQILKQYIDLTEEEEFIIKYHMGLFSICGFIKEYEMEDLYNAISKYPSVQIFAACDNLDAHSK